MLTGMNKIFEKHQKLLLTIVGTIIIVPFIGFVPGADLFSFFNQNNNQKMTINGQTLNDQQIQQQLISFQVGYHLGIKQNYQNNIKGDNNSSLIALHRFALIKKLKNKYDFSAIKNTEIANFLKDKFQSIKTAKLYLKNIQQNLAITPKKMESIIIENYFIQKNDEEIGSQLQKDEKTIKNAYIKENTQYTINALKLNSSDNSFLDKDALEYYNNNKKDYSQPESTQVHYINFNKNSITSSQVDNLDAIIKERFEANKQKYRFESKQKKVGLIGFTIEDFNDTNKTTIKRKLFDRLETHIKKVGFNKTIQTHKYFDYQTTFWEGEQTNTFNKTIQELKKGEISELLSLRDEEDFPQGLYLIQVIDERSGVLTNLVKTIITEEILKEKNKRRNKILAYSLFRSINKDISKLKNLQQKTEIFTKRANVLKFNINESPFFKTDQKATKIYSKTFLQNVQTLSEKNPLSKVIINNDSYVVAFFKKRGNLYKDFNNLKDIIKEKIYLKQAQQYYDNNKEIFKTPQIKYGYAVNFYPNIQDYKVNNKEALTYFRENKKNYDQKQAEVRLISLNFKKGQKNNTKEKLKKIANDIKTKKITFQQAAIKYSEDKETNNKEKAGLLGWVTKNRHNASKTIFATKKDNISDIHENSTNLQIFQVQQTSNTIPYPRVKDNIIKSLKRQKAIEASKSKKEKFYQQIEAALTTKGQKNFSQEFRKIARNNGYASTQISTTTRYRYIENLINDLETRTIENPLIINEQDLWVGCYDRTQKANLPSFENAATKRKAIYAINKQKSIERVNKRFTTIFAELNKADNKIALQQKYNFIKEKSTPYKELQQAYKTLIEDNTQTNQVFATKNNTNEHIIFTIDKKQIPTDQEFAEAKEEFIEQYNKKEKEKSITQFYQKFIDANIISL